MFWKGPTLSTSTDALLVVQSLTLTLALMSKAIPLLAGIVFNLQEDERGVRTT